MKKVSKFNAGLALGSLTAVVALFAGASVASAQTAPATDNTQVSQAAAAPSNSQVAQAAAPGLDTSVAGQAAPGGGSFPGSFLVPGTNTSLKIGGFAKLAIMDDLSATTSVSPDVVASGDIALRGSSTSSNRGNFNFNPRQSTFFFDARTPTSYGELDTFIQADFFGQNISNSFGASNTRNARLVLAYGTLGPLLGGQTLSLWFDGDAIGETVDPTASVGTMNGLTNRQGTVRYTYVAGGGLSFAGAVEQPNVEGIDNAGMSTAITASGTPTPGGANTFAQKYPDFVVKGRWDQAWGHIALAGVLRNQEVQSVGVPNYNDSPGWGGYLSGHLNTFGKDTLRAGGMIGQALGHFLSDMGSSAGIETNTATAGVDQLNNTAVTKPLGYGVNASYTHWWTDQLRSTVMGGYSHVNVNTTSIITLAAAQNGIDKTHIAQTVNLIWSPVPQVDLGIEYTHYTRMVAGPFENTQSRGNMNRIEAMTVFKF
jgi:Porin subfamily